jgi:hypothetical protein
MILVRKKNFYFCILQNKVMNTFFGANTLFGTLLKTVENTIKGILKPQPKIEYKKDGHHKNKNLSLGQLAALNKELNGRTQFSKNHGVVKSSKKPISKLQNSNQIPKQKTPEQREEEIKRFNRYNRLDPDRPKAPRDSANFSTNSSYLFAPSSLKFPSSKKK